jgi:hypothetical protein
MHYVSIVLLVLGLAVTVVWAGLLSFWLGSSLISTITFAFF